MRLTGYTDFSLRVLMYIALNPERKSTIGEIAESYGLSKNNLMKVVCELGQTGYVQTIRGKNGGLLLGRPAEEIVLGDIVRLTEPDMALAPCFEPTHAPCVISPACRLRAALHRAMAAFLHVLDEYTLKDLVENRVPLGELLAAGPSTAGRGQSGSVRIPEAVED
jgi:Rrf2 family nitric oxide-sensitive transcriptional repressor